MKKNNIDLIKNMNYMKIMKKKKDTIMNKMMMMMETEETVLMTKQHATSCKPYLKPKPQVLLRQRDYTKQEEEEELVGGGRTRRGGTKVKKNPPLGIFKAPQGSGA
uniref:Uncharacterized protein n=1 Tax=Cacopsylla melanoneura TaxID=428564 RepID=A0A8D9BAZ6_9HEMI